MARRKIILKGDPIRNDDEVAVEALTPGHVVELTSSGVQKNTDDAANVAMAIVVEEDERGKDIDDAYAIGDVVKVAVCRPGDRAYVFLASGQNVAKGAYLTVNTAGLFTAASVSASVRSARTLEAVNATAGAVAGTRIRVEFV